MTPNHYNVLGISHSASDDEIKKSYRELALKHHPDMKNNKDSAASSDVFQQIQASYDILSDPIKRMVYDRDHFGAGMSIRTSNFKPSDGYGRASSSEDHSSIHYKPLTAQDVDKMFAGSTAHTVASANRVSAARFQSRVAATSFAQRKAQRVSHVSAPASSIGWAITVPLLVASVWGVSTWYSHTTAKEREKKHADTINRVTK